MRRAAGRRRLMLEIALPVLTAGVVAAAGFTAASSLASHGISGSPAAVGQAPPSWDQPSLVVQAGASFSAILNPSTARACGLVARGPLPKLVVSWNFNPGGQLLRFSFITNTTAARGRWVLRATCGQANGRTPLLADMTVTVVGSGGGRGLLVEHRNLRVTPIGDERPQTPPGSLSSRTRVVKVSVQGGGHGGASDPGDDYPPQWRNAPQDSVLDNWREYNRECTSFVAWALASRNGFSMPFYANAIDWGPKATAAGFRVDAVPAPGAVAWSGAGKWGHVAYVQDVSGSSVHIEEYNEYGNGTYSSRVVPASSFTGYIHFKDIGPPPFDPAAYNGHIVKQDNNSSTSWLVVDAAGHRNWIPSAAVYNCLKAAGHPGPDYLSAAQLDQLPDQTGVWATCTPPTTTTTTTTVVTTVVTTTALTPGDTSPPVIPTGFSVSGVTESSATVSWQPSSDNVGTTGYDVYLNGALVNSTTATSFAFSGLDCGTTYSVSVDAFDAAGNRSDQSAGFPFSTSACPGPSLPIFTVMNTDETQPDGVWFRNSPHTNDTSRITGLGVYRNEQVQLQCYAFGDAVGQYQNRLWYYVTNVTRRTVAGMANQGYLNAHYINDGQVANVVDAGVPAC